jgi:lipopolysaccharide/colanic/teichoic acid biosynthesis glycosyltransferase
VGALISKRLFDMGASTVALVLLLPVFLLLAIWVKLDSPGPVFFRQVRVGINGREFRIHKFRTMRTDAERSGLQVTVGTDARITRAGAFLRRYKLDELPQLLDVLAGDMSIVGPRPEVPRYMDAYPPEVRSRVLSVRPGITDWASVEFRSESSLLANAADPERTYVEEILPIKQGYYLRYVDERSFFGDLKIIFATLLAMFRG